MSHRLTLLLIASLLSACATSVSTTSLPERAVNSASSSANGSQPRSSPDSETSDPIVSSDDDSDIGDGEVDGVIESARVPEVPKTDVGPAMAEAALSNNLICRVERRTGSNRPIRVCRTRAQIEQAELDGKDTFEELHRSQVEYEQ